MITQQELELDMYKHGQSKSYLVMAKNEEKGRADNNPYAQALYRRFVLPLAEIIKEDVRAKRIGRRQAHVQLLASMDEEAVAFIAVRNTLNALMGNGDHQFGEDSVGMINARSVMTAVGRSVYHELLLLLFEDANPDLFYTLVNDLGRRMSKSERHRMVVFKMQAQKAGIDFPEWGGQGTQQVGAYLLEQLEQLGMVELSKSTTAAARANQLRTNVDVRLSAGCISIITELKGMVAEMTPYYLPCVEQPRDWLGIADGGFHTNEMRRIQPFAVRSKGDWSEFEAHDMTKVFAGLNALQRTAWRINKPMLDIIRQVAKHFDMEEIISQAEVPAPPQPEWLAPGMKMEDMSVDQQTEFVTWKKLKAEWFTQMKLRGTKYGRFYSATTVADRFKEFPAIYFVYFADFRGRCYAQTTGVSPQGSDLQKALLEFSEGKPITTRDARRWFFITGANRWGYDKASLDDRVKWVKDRHDLLVAMGMDPINNRDWQNADKPLQFLAWCLEYAAWTADPEGFRSHGAAGMDGSCNGLQNFSAMLRDEVGGKATNLVPAELPNDIYDMVAKVTETRLRAARAAVPPEDDGTLAEDELKSETMKADMFNRFKAMWLAHGINRSLVKRSVMTLPYGSTRFSCADFIVADYLKAGKAPEFNRDDYGAAARMLSHFVWAAIADVVVKAREAMDWLQSCSKLILKNGEDAIRWTTPTGFPVAQFYQEQELHRINTRLCGNTKIRLRADTNTPCKHQHKNGIAPNFIHSYDAAHMLLVALVCGRLGLSLAMIHDDYGTHYADAQTMYEAIREVFVNMYEKHNPLEEFAAKYDLPPPPSMGNLDLRLVLASPYFFS